MPPAGEALTTTLPKQNIFLILCSQKNSVFASPALQKFCTELNYIKILIFQVVGNAVRQLQHLVTDESCVECYDLFLSESKSNGTGGSCALAAERQSPEMIYQKKAEKLLADENCMKIILVSLFKAQVDFTSILHTAFLFEILAHSFFVLTF
jgi:hypothetical protein